MKYKKVMNRRTFLRGAGTVAVGLPFLEEMRGSSVYAAEPDPVARVLTMFFGLGVPAPFQGNAFTAPYSDHLAPLAQVADKIAMLRGIHYQKNSTTSGNHARGSQTAFIGGRTTGASIDQVVLTHLHGNETPTNVRSLVAGTYTRQDGNNRHIHSWIGPGQPTAQPIESPQDLFDYAFGGFGPPEAGSGGEVDRAVARKARYEASILDSAIEDYKYVTSDAFGLSQASKAKVNLHLERLRELEQTIFDPDAPVEPIPANCEPVAPGEFTHPEMLEIQQTVNNEGVIMEVDRWMELWHAMVETYVMAVRCDVTRFGNIQFQSGGERIILYGDYTKYGQTRTFDDQTTSHDYWHGWSPGNASEARMLDHIWLFMAEVTHFLKALDDPMYLDPNGGTLLDNALTLVTTELGDGNSHNIEDVFHLVAGGNGALNLGGVLDVDAQATQLYNSCLVALGIEEVSMDGDPGYEGVLLPDILA